jgi:putative flippase GtrA
MGILYIIFIFILTTIFLIYYIISAVISYQILLILSFTLNEKWTFNSSFNLNLKNKWHRFFVFYFFSISGMVINIIILAILTGYFHIYYLISTAIATLIVFIWNYSINKKFIWN